MVEAKAVGEQGSERTQMCVSEARSRPTPDSATPGGLQSRRRMTPINLPWIRTSS